MTTGFEHEDAQAAMQKQGRGYGAGAQSYTGPLDGMVSRTVEVKLDERISVLDFGAIGNGIDDDTAAIQAALTEAARAGDMAVFLPAGAYLITAITIPAGVVLAGTSRMGWAHSGGVVYGTRFIIRQTATSAVTMGKGSSIEGIAFIYPDQPVTDETPAIIAYPVTIQAGSANGVRINEVWCSGAYDFIQVTSGATVSNIGGYPCRHGIYIASADDSIRINNVHFNPNYLVAATTIPYQFYAYCAQTLEGAVLRIISADDVKATNIFGFCGTYGVQTGIVGGAGGGSPSLQLLNFGFDQVRQGFNLGGNPGNFGIIVSNGYVTPNLGPDDTLRSGLHFRGLTGDSGGLFIFSNINFFGVGCSIPDSGPAEYYITGADTPYQNTITMRGCIFRHYTGATPYSLAAFSDCRVHIEGYHIPSSVTSTPDNYRLTEPFSFGDVDDKSVTGNDAITTVRLHLINLTNTSGTNTITLNAPSMSDGRILVLRCVALTAGTLTLDDSGAVALSAAWVPDAGDTLTLMASGSIWYEIARSAN